MGGGNTTTVQKSDPPEWALPSLQTASDMAMDLVGRGGFSAAPFAGDRVANPSMATALGEGMMFNRAMEGAPGVSGAIDLTTGNLTGHQNDQAVSVYSDYMSGPETDQATRVYSDYMQGVENPALAAAKNNAIGGVLPQVMAQFAGGGMANSTTAVDTATRAAVDAVAPYEYGAMESAANRAMSAADRVTAREMGAADRVSGLAMESARLAPSLEAAGYMPAQTIAQVGGVQDARNQAELDAVLAQYYEGQGQERANLEGFANLAALMSGQGGTVTSTAPGPSTGQRIGGSLLGGLGTYGALAANPVTAPFAIAGGIGSGLLGLF